ncbi:MAG: helix-turn-helix transcriptional regulator [Clostridia bacterium]|nr:helix-turn-helix transcriptional regulator [Clostridia bacterium]
MELTIGTNIKRLRIAKGLTQEQLAELLTISTAAVSKWESKNSYPDITMLFPLAEIFGVTVDELLGYDEAKAKADVDEILTKYHKLYSEGRFSEGEVLIASARKKYPHDYRIMNTYMWDKAGGSAGNKAETLLKHKDEFTQICDCILESCTQDDLRAEAINMKAKLLHAAGETDAALEILSKLPAWHAPMIMEQLFGKDTAEYRYWNKKNCYRLLDVMSFKLARILRFDPELSVAEKVQRMEQIAEAFHEMSKKKDLAIFCIGEVSVYATLAGMLTTDNAPIEDVIRIRKKHFGALERITELAKSDEILSEQVLETYKTDDPKAWLLHRLLNSPHPQFVKLRENPKYAEMLRQMNDANTL